MPRNMSFSLTTPQIRAKTKTVTRRIGGGRLARLAAIKAVASKEGKMRLYEELEMALDR